MICEQFVKGTGAKPNVPKDKPGCAVQQPRSEQLAAPEPSKVSHYRYPKGDPR